MMTCIVIAAAAAHDGGARRMQTTKAPLAPVDRLVVAEEPVETTELGNVWKCIRETKSG